MFLQTVTDKQWNIKLWLLLKGKTAEQSKPKSIQKSSTLNMWDILSK